MSRVRKHEQQEIFGPRGGVRLRAGHARPAVAKKTRARSADGSSRRGPGRPPKGQRAGAPHKTRPELEPRHPVHVVLRVDRAVGNLRKRFMYAALREATIAVALRELHDKEQRAFRIVHISIQRDHVHLIVEADNKLALSRGMQSFQISAAKHLNRAVSRKCTMRRRGTVFPDRFHQEIITNPKQARNTLSYVLNNWRKHEQDRGELQRTWMVDPFSTGAQFGGWKELEHRDVMWKVRDSYPQLVVYFPRTWLLRVGWRIHGPIKATEIPGPKLRVHDVA